MPAHSDFCSLLYRLSPKVTTDSSGYLFLLTAFFGNLFVLWLVAIMRLITLQSRCRLEACVLLPVHHFLELPQIAARERCYKQIATAVAKYQAIKKNVNEGLNFCATLQINLMVPQMDLIYIVFKRMFCSVYMQPFIAILLRKLIPRSLSLARTEDNRSTSL